MYTVKYVHSMLLQQIHISTHMNIRIHVIRTYVRTHGYHIHEIHTNMYIHMYVRTNINTYRPSIHGICIILHPYVCEYIHTYNQSGLISCVSKCVYEPKGVVIKSPSQILW